MISDPTLLPPSPDPTTIEQWTGQIRTLITLASGLGLGGAWLGHITDQQISAELTAVVTVAGLAVYAGTAVWSWVAKRWAADAARKMAVASASASVKLGAPVIVTETPPGLPNVATLISATEQAAAPSVPAGVLPTAAPRTL